MSDKIYIAKIGKAVGLNGEVKLHLDTDFPEQFKKGSTFLLPNNDILTIEKFNSNRNVAKFVGFDNCDTVKKIINKFLYTTTENTRENCNLQENQYFWFDLMGCSIIEDSKVLGKIKDINRYATTDYLEISTSEELTKQDLPKTFLIPYNEQYVQNVDLENKTVSTSNCFDILENS